MDAFHIVLLIVAAALAGFGAWLFAQRQRLASELARAAAEREAAVVSARAESATLLARAQGETEAARQASAASIGQLQDRLAEAKEAIQLAEERSLASGRRVVELSEAMAQLRERVDAAEMMRQEMLKGDERLREAFGSLSKQALASNSTEFLKLAEVKLQEQREAGKAEIDERAKAVEQLVKPISDTLARADKKLGEIDQKWVADQSRLGEQLRLMTEAEKSLREETGKLTKALSRPEIRGRYGEIQLRRVAELAGMTAYCDFQEQQSVRDAEGSLLRPDMVVRLPNERIIAVDAKANMSAYLEAVNASSDVERDECLDRFARHVAEQADKLSKKGYWTEFEGSPEFVVMFVPGDAFLDAALRRRPDLLDAAAQRHVILVTPASLIGLLRAVAVGWRENRMQEQARELFELGRELHDRAATALQHAVKLGDTIERAVKQYNDFAGSVESRLMPTLRRFEDAGVRPGKAIEAPTEITLRPRIMALPAPEAD